MTEAETRQHQVAMATRDLMSATETLLWLSMSKTAQPLVAGEQNDIRLAYTRLARMLSMMNA